MEALKQKNIKMFTVLFARRIVFALVLVLIFDLFLFAAPALAAEPIEAINSEFSKEMIVLPEINNNLPETSSIKAISSGYYTVTAYNSEVGQCDSTPCITANGFNVCEHGIEDTVAANWLPFGAKIRMPELFGDRVFYVRDRMNKRYSNRMDIWMLDKQDAKKFGIKVVKVEVLEH
jgi:3D (Asp-Asp-Asp) domain-containing protein